MWEPGHPGFGPLDDIDGVSEADIARIVDRLMATLMAYYALPLTAYGANVLRKPIRPEALDDRPAAAVPATVTYGHDTESWSST